jgi:hypothetical protein
MSTRHTVHGVIYVVLPIIGVRPTPLFSAMPPTTRPKASKRPNNGMGNKVKCRGRRQYGFLANRPAGPVGGAAWGCGGPICVFSTGKGAIGAGCMPIDNPRSSFHRICLNLVIWNRLMGRFEYTPVDSRGGL